MSNMTRLLLAAAALMAVACGGTVPIPSPTPTATRAPTATPSPTATASAVPTPAVTSSPVALPDEGSLVGGTTYRVDAPGTEVDMIVTVPAGWQTFSGFIYKPSNGRPKVMLSHWHVEDVYHDPCHWAQEHTPIGPTVNDLANALSDQLGRDASEPTDAVVGGYPAKQVNLSVPDNFEERECDNGQFRTWISGPTPGEYGGFVYGRGQRDSVYSVDVAAERIVIHRLYMPSASETDLAELQALFDSVRLEP
jgi:hypothetical protein